MIIFIFCCWYLAGVVSLIIIAKLTGQHVSSNLLLIILGGLLGPFGLLIGLLLKDVPTRRPEFKQPCDIKDTLWE
jgi:hypothetical protein